MAYWKFLLRHPRLLSFGVLLTLFSSFGQTFLISIFVPDMLETFSLNSGQFGTLYTVATLCSALSLPFFGRVLDRTDPGRYSLCVGAGLIAACWLMALAPNVAFLFAGLLGLRLAGQGLLGLTAATTMAKAFTDFRGRALSISATGYPLGEGILPILVVLLIRQYGWRLSWGITGLFIGVVLLPLIVHLVKAVPNRPTLRHVATPLPTRNPLFVDPIFYLYLPGVMAGPFVTTGCFLYQSMLGDFAGYSAALMATGFTCFAAVRLCASFIAGPWVDRLGASRVFPLILLPLALGLVFLRMRLGVWNVYLFFGLAGVSQGLAGVVGTALWAERYGSFMLGRIKSTVTMLGVIATALSPAVFGWMLTVGFGFGTILPLTAALCIVAAAAGRLAHMLSRNGVDTAGRASCGPLPR